MREAQYSTGAASRGGLWRIVAGSFPQSFAEHAEVFVDFLGQSDEALRVDRLDVVMFHAELHRTPSIALLIRARQDDHGNLPQVRLLGHPFQHLEAGSFGQFDVEENEARERISRAVSEGSLPRE